MGTGIFSKRQNAADHRDVVARLTEDFQTWKAGMKPQAIADDHPLYSRHKTMKPKP